ncbi:voltage-dependent calcium channel subunit alpha-2/delta-2-like [Ptychodera flava]|uniref:voltage-dependent calcium channel subunit alpha-2/delta-2-like n=1 Tax=Ptychodera flava TaxID=63121 RepID=UPI00396A7101
MHLQEHSHKFLFRTAIFLAAVISVLASAYENCDCPDRKECLAGNVQNWATLIQNYILQLASDGLKTSHMQSFYDQANYTMEKKDGTETVQRVKNSLKNYFSKKEQAARRIADAVVQFHDDNYRKAEEVKYKRLQDLPLHIYKDSDIPNRLPVPLTFSPYFKQNVNSHNSVVKISDEVPRDNNATINTVLYTYGLDAVFRNNTLQDKLLRWQYFGSKDGILRMYPGREWDTNFAGFYNDYDPRVRPWYIAATSGPKDVVIILDCSHSMVGKKFDIGKAVVKTILNTLTKQDYVNVICARASHWDEVGKWHFFSTEILSCQDDRLVPASTAHRKDLKEKLENLKPGGTSELQKAFDKSFELLSSITRTGCQSFIIVITDGKDTDGEPVRCGPGYYTRSGYVPGPICKYSWEKVWNQVKELNEGLIPKARIFSYLTIDDGEEFPGKLACDNRGSMKKLLSGNNLISQMNNYFEFLSSNTEGTSGLWTSPYLDAWGLGLMVTIAIPAVSKETNKVIGVAGIDATLEEIENLIVNEQWGSVYAFLINNEGETIFHPLMKPSSNLVDDPIFIPISQLEQREGRPEEFTSVEDAMKRGDSGYLRIENAYRGLPKGDFADGVKLTQQPASYYYTALNDSVYAFAFNLADSDMTFRRTHEPDDTLRKKLPVSYFNLLIEYDSPLGRSVLPEVYEELDVKTKERKYPGLRVSYKHSSFMLAPKCYCDPNSYLFDEDLANKTVTAHLFMNGNDTAKDCTEGSIFEKNIRADVLITSQIEEIWKNRKFELLKDVKWTYCGCRSGTFRTYPGHRSRRTYDPTKRPWFHRTMTNPDKTAISTAYMDAAGVGKIISISQAIFEGMPEQTKELCDSVRGKKPGGCVCDTDEECVAGKCYISTAPGYEMELSRCASEKVEAVTALDILYNDFHTNVYETMSDGCKPCGSKYTCPNGDEGCQTRCYLFDNFANLVTDPEFIHASNLDERQYKRVSFGKKEGEVMHELIYKHNFFQRKEQIDFQGSCSVSPYAPKVTLEGIAKTPEELDDYFRNKGPIPSFSNNFGCIQDVVGYQANSSALGPSGMITGNITGPCKSGFYYLTALPKTNLFLLVMENWRNDSESNFFNFNCRITNSISGTGAFRIINGTCAHTDEQASLALEQKCPVIKDINVACTYLTASTTSVDKLLLLLSIVLCLFSSRR